MGVVFFFTFVKEISTFSTEVSSPGSLLHYYLRLVLSSLYCTVSKGMASTGCIYFYILLDLLKTRSMFSKKGKRKAEKKGTDEGALEILWLSTFELLSSWELYDAFFFLLTLRGCRL